jgi:hypothetical protein
MYKKIAVSWFAAIALTAASANTLAENPRVMLGISYSFGKTVGFTLKVASDNDENTAMAVAGVSYFPWEPTAQWGLDIGVGYTAATNTLITTGWDFLNNTVQVSTGYMNTEEENDSPYFPIVQRPPPPAP